MILYFSATGNSEYVADRVAHILDDSMLSLFDRIKNQNFDSIESNKPYVIVTPTYGWQIPHIVRDWLVKASFDGNKDVYFVLTCGSEIGNAQKYLIKLCQKINMNYCGCAEIVMPENYLALFEVPNQQQAKQIIEAANPVIDKVAIQISNHQRLVPTSISMLDHIKSSLINAVFYPTIVHAKKFYVKDHCIGCGICEKACVMNNIQFQNQKPIWQDHCTHCMACISKCPVEAIEYGKNSVGKLRYQCPK
ncbi:MAG: EFR1 family ferrodoxin [Erysipelotrichaceae bacterium]|nr:EFR1 family ferrodoxin [Erysipelotrichaceae bacterium]